jgi:hypothetical protein
MMLLGLLGTPLGRGLAIGLGALLLVFGALAAASHHGAQSVRKADEKAQIARQAQIAAVNSDTASLATKAGSDAKAAQSQIAQHTKTLQEHAHAAVPPSADVRLNGGFVGLYNASLGLVPYDPAASPGTDSAAGAVRASDALETIAGNDGVCLAWRDRAERLTAFYGAVRVKVNGK